MTTATSAAATAGNLFQLIRTGAARTRPDLSRLSGLSRTAIAQRVSALVDAGLVVEHDPGESTGGRPAARLGFNAESGLVLAADFGVTHCRLAISTLDGTVLTELPAEQPIAQGPDHVLGWAADRFDEMLADLGRNVADVRGIGVGVPGPVEFSAGRAVAPPIMPGWDGVPIPQVLGQRFPVPVLVDNDVNIMAIGEHDAVWPNVDDLLFVKIGTGIGCGIIARGAIHRGAQGAAGDIGHIQIQGDRDVSCHCGNHGCVEAVASGYALASQLRDLGHDCPDARGVGALVAAGNRDALRLVRQAGRQLGEVLAGLVNAFNPAVIVIGGDVAASQSLLLAGVREVIYQRSTALATRGLELEQSRLGDRAGVHGAVTNVLNEILSAETIDAALRVA